MSWKIRIFLLLFAVIAVILLIMSLSETKEYQCVIEIKPVIKADSFYYHLSGGSFFVKKVYHRGNLDKTRFKNVFHSWGMEKLQETVQQTLIKEGINARVYRMIPHKISSKSCNSTVYIGLKIRGPFERRGTFLLVDGSVFRSDQFFRLLLGPYAH